MRSGCRGFESRSGHLIFSSICSVYIDRHIGVDLSDDEQFKSFIEGHALVKLTSC